MDNIEGKVSHGNVGYQYDSIYDPEHFNKLVWKPPIRPEVKETNPKDAVGVKKVPMSTVPATVLMELGLAMMEGARKYGRHNYRVAGVRSSVYYDAAMRHLMDWWEGEDTDPDSGLSHVTKAIASLTVLRDSMIKENWTDDRPRRNEGFSIKVLNEKAAEIIEKYPDSKDAFTEKNLYL